MATVTEKKIEVYTDMMELFMLFLGSKALKSMTPKKQDALGRKMADIGAGIALFGSAEVVAKYVNFRLLSQGEAPPEKILDSFADVILEMRTDMGSGGEVTSDLVLGTFLVLSDKLEDYK